jgi:hypothetical protein
MKPTGTPKPSCGHAFWGDQIMLTTINVNAK